MVNRDTERPKIKPMTKEITMFLDIGTCILTTTSPEDNYDTCSLINITTGNDNQIVFKIEVNRCRQFFNWKIDDLDHINSLELILYTSLDICN